VNHHPLHIDAATNRLRWNCVVVGNQVYSLLLGMPVPDVSGKAIANLEVESLRHVASTIHGDTIYSGTTVLDKRESGPKPARRTTRWCAFSGERSWFPCGSTRGGRRSRHGSPKADLPHAGVARRLNPGLRPDMCESSGTPAAWFLAVFALHPRRRHGSRQPAAQDSSPPRVQSKAGSDAAGCGRVAPGGAEQDGARTWPAVGHCRGCASAATGRQLPCSGTCRTGA
jgi:hypothetical protein